MNDDRLEHHLRELPAPELPAAWRDEILSAARRESRAKKSAQAWPPILLFLRRLIVRNPWTSSALTTLWVLIFLFHANTPVDPSEKLLIAHFDPNRPIYIVSLRDEIELADLLQDPPSKPPQLIP